MSKTTLPGFKAHHSIISNECREGRTDTGAVDEAIARARKELLNILPYWDPSTTRFHVVVTIERGALESGGEK